MDIFSSEMVLSESMKRQLRQMCIYARIAGIDMEAVREALHDKGILPCTDKNGSKKALSEIYAYVACSF
ncbi:MAG: hypothetical protein K5871_05370 [Lachnospiraceae bacterium]|nr:hypothetical protein [Lachnospiraceae bacterium]